LVERSPLSWAALGVFFVGVYVFAALARHADATYLDSNLGAGLLCLAIGAWRLAKRSAKASYY